MSLKVFITGGTTGIGLALAKKFKSRGAIVAVSGRSREKYEASGEQDLIFYQADVADREQMSVSIKHFIQQQQGLDILIANAGIGYSEKKTLPDMEFGRKVFEINTFGVMNSFEPAIEYMANKKSGQLVAVSSIAGYNGLPGTSAYSASKAAVSKLCESFSIDLKKFGIAVTCINPGFVDTPLTQKNDHPMPFMVPVELAAEKFYQAIIKKKKVFAYPHFFAGLVRLLSIIPRSWYIALMGLKFFNYSKD